MAVVCGLAAIQLCTGWRYVLLLSTATSGNAVLPGFREVNASLQTPGAEPVLR